jgi:hypothetical protein
MKNAKGKEISLTQAIKERDNEQRFASAVELARQRGYLLQQQERDRKRIGSLVGALRYLELSPQNEGTLIEAIEALLIQDSSTNRNYYNRSAKADPACYVCGCAGCESVCDELLEGEAKEYAERQGKLGKKCCGHEWGKGASFLYGDLPF